MTSGVVHLRPLADTSLWKVYTGCSNFMRLPV